MKKAVLKTILAGIGREVEEAEKDLGLAELEQKKNKSMTKAWYIQVGALQGLSAKETLLLPAGVVFDLLELYLQSRGKRERIED